MGGYLKDTPPEPGRCIRCDQVVLICHVDGTKVAADIRYLDLDDYRQAVIDGRMTYDVTEQGGKLHRLRSRTPATPWAPGRMVVQAHGCGAKAMDAPSVELVPVNPPKAPATPGNDSDGRHPQRVLDEPQTGAQGHPWQPPAQRATHRRSNVVALCDNCGRAIRTHQRHVAVFHGQVAKFAYHTNNADCANTARNMLGTYRTKNADWDALDSMSKRNKYRRIENLPLPDQLVFEDSDADS